MDAKQDQGPEYARIGSTLENRYRLLDVLAQGGMGVVYRGERIGLNRTVAVKFLHASFASNAQARDRFERELQAMSRLTHPNCVSVIDYGIADSPFIVMEYVTGRTLKDVLAENGPLQPARALYIASQILAALAHAHSQDMVHRDIKPANIILADVEGTLDHVYVLDFGLAKFMSGAAKNDDLTASWMVLGTPAYMSPEQGRAESIGAASDIYATGVVLFELLTGTKPYNADNPIDTIHLHQFAPLPSIRERLPEADFSAELDEAIQTALAKDPGQRFASAQLFAEALDFAPEAVPTRTSTRLRALTVPPGRARAESTQLGSSDGVSQAALVTSLLGGAPAAAGSPGAAAPAGTGGTVSLSNSDIQVVSSAAIVLAGPAHTVAPNTPPDPARTDTAAPPETPGDEAASPPAVTSAAPAKPRTRGSTRWLVLASMFLTVAGLVTWYATRDEVLQPVDTSSPRPADELTGTPPATEPATARTSRDERAARGAQTTARKPTLPAQEQHASPTPSPAEPTQGQTPAQNAATPGEGQAAAATATTPDPGQPSPKPPEPEAPVDSIADVERLIQQGRRDDAIQGILRLRRTTFPRSGYLAYLLGNLYFDKMYWDDGLDAYIDAVKFTPQYRSNANVNENAIRALSHDQARHKATALFTGHIRRSGLKYLRKAAASDKNPKVRQRAKALLTRISRGRR